MSEAEAAKTTILNLPDVVPKHEAGPRAGDVWLGVDGGGKGVRGAEDDEGGVHGAEEDPFPAIRPLSLLPGVEEARAHRA